MDKPDGGKLAVRIETLGGRDVGRLAAVEFRLGAILRNEEGTRGGIALHQEHGIEEDVAMLIGGGARTTGVTLRLPFPYVIRYRWNFKIPAGAFKLIP